MKTSNLLKAVPIAALALSVYSAGAIAGATNKGDNTSATPGEDATTTTTPAQGATGENIRRGTTNTQDMETPKRSGDVGSGSAGGTGSDKSMKHKNKHNKSGSSSSSSSGSSNADQGVDATTGNSSGASTGSGSSQY
ncbi:MAG TPA: hypothetical protein VFF75_09035 [Methylophilaceae bacterium]|nr:hypothetical protein [Methylophilaceae bacterium]